MATPATGPKLVKPAASKTGNVLNVVGDQVIIKIDGNDNGGALAAMETVTPPGGGTPPHRHTREDESFYVIAGAAEFTVAGQIVRASAGAFVFAPRGIPHQYRNRETAPLRMLAIAQPAGIERFFEEASDLAAAGPPTPQALTTLAQRYGIEILGPPPGR
jgi:quercetin dioxygenase-like cupin family protein